VAAGLLIVLIGAITTWALWPDPEPRQREYLDATACLLTDEDGVGKEPATSVWAAMGQISVTTLVRVQNLSVIGPQTAGNAEGFVNSLTGGGCNVIIAVGNPQITAVTKAAGANPDARFITVNGGTPTANVQVINTASADDLRNGITAKFSELAEAAS
jgi:basic membrane lipoprotein Med (substrate-binding protein (PBP1-ABC) superfamily)